MNILILTGNPKRNSFSSRLSDTYATAASAKANIRYFNLSEMEFNSNLENAYDADQALEPCLVTFQEALIWAEHIVIVSPIWWGGIPAKLKGLIDRTFLPNVTFRFEEGNPEPIPLLTEKTAQLILTMDAPMEFAKEQAEPVLAQLDRYTLKFCGIDCKYHLFGSVISADETQRQKWIQTVKELGENCL